MKVGIGYDVHRFSKGRKLILGGVIIPFLKGLKGHSDADVLMHAVCDSILGALGLGDIGHHFPDTDSKYKDISSEILLRKVVKMMKKCGYEISNVDTVMIMETPRISRYVNEIKMNMAAILSISKRQLNIKATTNEGMGWEGKKEGIGAWAIVLLVKSGKNTRSR